MYAIFKDGGHQYKAEVGKKMYLELRDVEPGTPIELTEVLAISKEGEVKVGQPTIPGAKIIAEAMTKEKGPKLVIRWFRRRKNSRKKTGAVKRTLRSKSKKSSKAEFNLSVRA
jgi:large subunit ribosomal protein L21